MGTNSLCTYLSVSFQVDPLHETLQHTVSFKSSVYNNWLMHSIIIAFISAADVHRAGRMFVIIRELKVDASFKINLAMDIAWL